MSPQGTHAAGPGGPSPAGSGPLGRHVLIVGGGASGVLLAAQLLRRDGARVKVTVVEKGALLGCGIAYATTDPAHLLNTRVANMSAYPGQPDHFLTWLRAEGGPGADPQGFVTRATYGRYLGCLLDLWAETAALDIVQAECLGIEVEAGRVVARLAGGRAVAADLAVLATGHALPSPGQEPGLSQPWCGGSSRCDEPCDGPVLIVGSGLTMVDQVLSLLAAGHPGPITAVSRRGLLPEVHRPTDPVRWRADELPEPGAVAPLMRWLRAQAAARQAEGGDWRDAVDGLRPHLQAIWRALPLPSRRTFLRHASPYWEVHRHRMPPASHARLGEAMAAGRLRLVRARFEGVAPEEGGGLVARLVTAGGALAHMKVARVVDCRGIRRDPETHATPLVAGLLAAGHAAVDPLRLGLDVGPDCEVLRPDGRPTGRLYAMGPASRAAFWEVTAIPDIRAQAEGLAERLAGQRLDGAGP